MRFLFILFHSLHCSVGGRYRKLDGCIFVMKEQIMSSGHYLIITTVPDEKMCSVLPISLN